MNCSGFPDSDYDPKNRCAESDDGNVCRHLKNYDDWAITLRHGVLSRHGPG